MLGKLLPPLCLALALSPLCAEEGPMPAPPPAPQPGVVAPAPQTIRTLQALNRTYGLTAAHEAKVKASYAGVEVASADATLRKQLKLPDGFGLAVKGLDSEGPAAKAGVQVHDVLFKLKDQMLANVPQFVALVRTYKPGEKFDLVLIREGVQQTVSVTTVEKELPPLEAYTLNDGAPDQNQFWFRNMPLEQGVVNKWMPLPNATGEMRLDDGDLKMELSTKDGKTILRAQSKDGKVLYDGEFTPDNPKIPEEIREKVKQFDLLMNLDEQGFNQDLPQMQPGVRPGTQTPPVMFFLRGRVHPPDSAPMVPPLPPKEEKF